jgi:hypothetical protein
LISTWLWTFSVTAGGLYEAAVLMTNDSDLLEPVPMVRQQFGLPVGMITPRKHPSRVLVQHDVCETYTPWRAQTSRFPNPMTDPRGILRKSASW